MYFPCRIWDIHRNVSRFAAACLTWPQRWLLEAKHIQQIILDPKVFECATDVQQCQWKTVRSSYSDWPDKIATGPYWPHSADAWSCGIVAWFRYGVVVWERKVRIALEEKLLPCGDQCFGTLEPQTRMNNEMATRGGLKSETPKPKCSDHIHTHTKVICVAVVELFLFLQGWS